MISLLLIDVQGLPQRSWQTHVFCLHERLLEGGMGTAWAVSGRALSTCKEGLSPIAFAADPVDQEDLYLELRPVPLEFEGTKERTFDPTSASLEAACCQGWACCVVFIYWGRRRLFHSGPFTIEIPTAPLSGLRQRKRPVTQ